MNSFEAKAIARGDRQIEEGRADDILRLALELQTAIHLQNGFDLTKDKDIRLRREIGTALLALENMFKANERVIARHEGRGMWDEFRLYHRLLAGQAVEFADLAARRPEAPCNAFKASELNRVLRKLRDLMEDDMQLPLPLVSEEGEHSYSDVSVILRTYKDVCAAFTFRHFTGNPPKPHEFGVNWDEILKREEILLFCQEEPRSILEIADMLNYKDKKSVRRYLNPLLQEGVLARTVPHKPNSRNQKYYTARLL